VLEALHVGIGPGIQTADVTVLLPADEEGWSAVLAKHLEDLAVVLGFTGVVCTDHQPITRPGAEYGS
jgi:hypothetical protein